MIWQGLALWKAKDEDAVLWLLGITLGVYLGYKLVFKSRVDAVLSHLETLMEEN